MKTLIVILLLSSAVFASEQKDYTFTYRMGVNGRVQKYRCFSTNTWEKAFESCATQCFEHFKSMSYKMTEERGLDIIDSCVNPKE